MATKDFITYSPNTGNKNQTISVSASNNSGDSRSTILTIAGNGVNKTITISQQKGSLNILNFKINGISYEIYELLDSNPKRYNLVDENIQVKLPSNKQLTITWIVEDTLGLNLYPGSKILETGSFRVLEVIGDYDDPDYPDNFRMGVVVECTASLPQTMLRPNFGPVNEMDYNEWYVIIDPLVIGCY